MATPDPAATKPVEAFVAEVRAEMGRQGLRQIDLAALTTMTPNSLHRRLTGKSSVDLADAHEIAKALGVPLHELIARAEQAVSA